MNAPLATPAPSRLERLLTAAAERCNPVLVRVVRQELRNRSFVAVFMLLLTGGVVAALVVALLTTAHDRSDPGISNGFFGTMAWVWSFAAVLVQPLGCFRAIANERNEDTWDLVELTGLRPLAVVGGLMLSSLVQGVLYASALAPFMVMAYLLRGIDLMAVLYTLVLVPVGGVAASALAVFAACLADNKASRTVLFALLGLGLVTLWASSAGMWYNLTDRDFDQLFAEIRNGGGEVLLGLGMVANLWLAFVGLMLVLATTLLTHRAGNRSSAARLYWYALWANGLLWMALPALVIDGVHVDDALLALGIYGAVTVGLAGILGLFAICEEWELSPRQARALEGSRWRRAAMLLLGPGAARGRLAWLALAFAGVALSGVALVVRSCLFDVGWQADVQMAAFTIAWAIAGWLGIGLYLADRLARGWCAGWFPTPALRRGFTLLVLSMVCVLPPLVFLVIGVPMEHGLAFCSPVTTGMALGDPDKASLAGFVAFSLVAAAALLWQLVEGLRLRVTLQRVVARDDDRNPRGG